MPKNWTRDLWIKETTVGGMISGERTRSELLIAIDDALRTYEHATPDKKLRALHQLFDAYDAWCASKTNVTDSIRDKGGNIADFKAWLDQEETKLLPTVEAGWDGLPNCYAYAMKCKQFAGNVPTPGAFAGKPVLTADPRWQQQQQRIRYYASLLEGIVDDAKACGKVVEILRGPAEGSLPSPINPPIDRANGATYIAAMVIKSTGFHFMRRDSRTGLWSHKNGGMGSSVETGATLLPAGARKTVRHVPMTDALVMELLQGRTDTYMGFPDYQFGGYVLVPNDGIRVSGVI